MGDIIDTEKIDKNVRCQDVKKAVIFINLIGAPVSFIALLISIIRMILRKKRLSFLTYIILFIFSSEIINTISKMLQLFKYCYHDTRDADDDNTVETPRGIICQIQIVTSIISDLCSLLGTLLLSIRCYDVMKNKIRFFDRKKVKILSFCIIIIVSIIISLSLLFIDRSMTDVSVYYKYDRRDRCSYWCWLCHDASLIIYSIYLIIVVLNIFYACKTFCYLKKGYKTLLDQSLILTQKDNMICLEDNNDKNVYSEEDRKKIEDLRIMQLKCIVYPLITNLIWVFLTIYRISDDIIMKAFDNEETVESDDEMNYFNERPDLKRTVQAFLVIHTLLSSMRGLLYGLSFIIFEEKIFSDCFRKCINCCHLNNLNNFDLEEDNKEILRNSASSLAEVKNGKEENADDRKSSVSDLDKNNNDMNSSDYHYND